MSRQSFVQDICTEFAILDWRLTTGTQTASDSHSIVHILRKSYTVFQANVLRIWHCTNFTNLQLTWNRTARRPRKGIFKKRTFFRIRENTGHFCTVSVSKYLRQPASRHTHSLPKHIWQRRTNAKQSRLSSPETLRLSINKEQWISHKKKSEDVCLLATGRTVSWWRHRRLSALSATDSQPLFTWRCPTRSMPHPHQRSSHLIHFVLWFLTPADAVCSSSDLSSSSRRHSHVMMVATHIIRVVTATAQRTDRTANFQRSQIKVTKGGHTHTHNLLPLNLLNSHLYLIRSAAGTIHTKYVSPVPDNNSIGWTSMNFRFYIWLRST